MKEEKKKERDEYQRKRSSQIKDIKGKIKSNIEKKMQMKNQIEDE